MTTKPLCAYCGSDHVRYTTKVLHKWDMSKQWWNVMGGDGYGYCNVCDCEVELVDANGELFDVEVLHDAWAFAVA